MEDDTSYKLLRYMDLAMDPVPAEEFAVDDFAVRLLTMLGYVPRSRMARTRMDIPLTIYGEQRQTRTASVLWLTTISYSLFRRTNGT